MKTKSMLLVASVLLVGVVFQANLCSAQQVWLGSMYDSILLDSIPGPVFAPALTVGHQYRISVYGNAQPIANRAFIQYESNTEFTFNVVKNTAPITFTAGYWMFCAYIVDHADSADNSGYVHVVITDLTGGGADTLNISSHDQSVMIDQQTGPKLVTLVGNANYVVSIDTSNANPIPNKACILYEDSAAGYTIDVVTKSNPIYLTKVNSSWHYAYVWITDWVNRWDNQGSTSVTFTRDGGVEEEKSESRDQNIIGSLRSIPNPFTSFATLPGHEAERFTLYDISGRQVGTYRGDRVGADLEPGVYFLRNEGKDAKPLRIVKLK